MLATCTCTCSMYEFLSSATLALRANDIPEFTKLHTLHQLTSTVINKISLPTCFIVTEKLSIHFHYHLVH